MQGRVKWFDEVKGFGFIEAEGVDADVFVHFSEIRMPGWKKLEENQVVHFDLFQSEKGYSAKNVQKNEGDGL